MLILPICSIRDMNTLVNIARERYPDQLSREEIEALGRRHLPYAEAVAMVCGEMQCSVSSYYRYYRGLLRPFSLGARARFCWEDEVLRAIARAKGARAYMALEQVDEVNY